MALEKQDQFEWIKNRSNIIVLAGVAFGTALFAVILAFLLFNLFAKIIRRRPNRLSKAMVRYIMPRLILPLS